METNILITMEDASSLTCGALLLSVVYQHSPWIHRQFYRGKVVFSKTVYAEGGFPKLAGLPTPWVKEISYYSFQNTKNFAC